MIGERLAGGRCGAAGDVVDVHQAAGAVGVEPHQGDHLGALRCRHQLQDPAAPRLAQVDDRIGGVIRAHPAKQGSDVGVGHVVKEPAGFIRVEFFEDVGFQFGVAAYPVEDLSTLGFVGLFEEVGDLGWFEGTDAARHAAHRHRAAVPDQRLERLPVPGSLSARRLRRPNNRGGRRVSSRASTHPSPVSSSSTS